VRVAGLSTPPNPLRRGQITAPAGPMPGGWSGGHRAKWGHRGARSRWGAGRDRRRLALRRL